MRMVSLGYAGMLTWILAAGSLIGSYRAVATEKSEFYHSFQQNSQRQVDLVTSVAAPLGPKLRERELSQLPPPGRGFRSIEISHQGMTRNYLIYTPALYNPNTPTPVVIGFHGGGTANLVFSNVTSFNRLADEQGFLVVYPSGVNGYWNDGRGTVNQGIDDVGFVTTLIEDLKRQRNIDASRIFVTGISNGAMLVQRLACERADRIAAFSSIAGSMPTPLLPNCNPSRRVPMMMVNSPNDKFVPWEGGEGTLGGGGSVVSIINTANFWGRQSICLNMNEQALPEIAPNDGTNVILRRYSSCPRNTGVLLYIIQGGGHTWPGGEGQSSRVLGPTSQEMDATRESWNFFRNFTLP